ncbi:MAG: hypothetical protein U1E62_07195 [Alsobacter sp.]
MLSLARLVLDFAIVVTALASAFLWWKASGQRLRRMDTREELDAHDINRIVTALNRTQILNSRAALATAVAAVLAGMRLVLSP